MVGFGRIGGNSVGIVANQPRGAGRRAGHRRSNKASRFIRFCNAFNIPIVTFVDVPGFSPGVKQNMAASSATAPAAVRLRLGDGAQDHRDPPQELRRRLAMCGRISAPTGFALADRRVAVMGAEGP